MMTGHFRYKVMDHPPRSKKAMQIPSGDFIALGKDEKSTKSSGLSSKRGLATSSSSSSLLSKKAKQELRHLEQEFERIAIDINPQTFVSQIEFANRHGDNSQIEKALCGAVIYLRNLKTKPPNCVLLGLLFLARVTPTHFSRSENVLAAFCSLLKRDIAWTYRAKNATMIPSLVCNVLAHCFAHEPIWPDYFVKVYMDDAQGERVWVDRKDCRCFTENVMTAFKSPVLPDSFFHQGDDSDEFINTRELVPVQVRYQHTLDAVERYTLSTVKEQLEKRQEIANKSLLRLMCVLCRNSEIRQLAISRLEIWLQNAKLSRSAQELMTCFCLNFDNKTQKDLETLYAFLKLKVNKVSKQILGHYLTCIRKLLTMQPELLSAVVTSTVYNELIGPRLPQSNNFHILSVAFQISAMETSILIARILQDLLCAKEDYMRAIKVFLRELVRATKGDFQFETFRKELLEPIHESQLSVLDQTLKDRVLASMVDLIIITDLLSVTPEQKEIYANCCKGDFKDVAVIHQLQARLAKLQNKSLIWLNKVALRTLHPQAQNFLHCVFRLLFMEKFEHYIGLDDWLSLTERSVGLKLMSEVPISEELVSYILQLALSGVLKAANAVDILDQMLMRALISTTKNDAYLMLRNRDVVDSIFQLCEYHHPDGIDLPGHYEPPKLAITKVYWKTMVIIFVLCTYNHKSLGLYCWETYPCIQYFMEMAMTNMFCFPSPSLYGDPEQRQKTIDDELKMSAKEKRLIVEFERLLAAKTTGQEITEASSLLLPQVLMADPNSPPRKPPSAVLEQLKSLTSLYKLGMRLCKSRDPDFLLEVIQKQGASSSMGWLMQLIENSDTAAVEVLPVSCRCEFLIQCEPETMTPTQDARHKEVLAQLHGVLSSNEIHNLEDAAEICEYLFGKMVDKNLKTRSSAVNTLASLVKRGTAEGFGWVLTDLPRLPSFGKVKQLFIFTITQVVVVETNVALIQRAILFLGQYVKYNTFDESQQIVKGFSRFLSKRERIVQAALPRNRKWSDLEKRVYATLVQIYLVYVDKARQEAQNLSNHSADDDVLIEWRGQESCVVKREDMYSMIILLACAQEDTVKLPFYMSLKSIWMSSDDRPKVHLIKTKQELSVYPDWLKFVVIKSRLHEVIELALVDVEMETLLKLVVMCGLSVNTMELIYQKFDIVAKSASEGLKQISNPQYLMTFMSSQWRKGVSSGHIAYELVEKTLAPFENITDGGEAMEIIQSPRKVLSFQLHRQESQETSQLSMNETIQKLMSTDGTVTLPEKSSFFQTIRNAVSANELTQVELLQMLEAHFTSLDPSEATTIANENQFFICLILRLCSETMKSDYGVGITKTFRDISSDGSNIEKLCNLFHKDLNVSSASSKTVLLGDMLEKNLTELPDAPNTNWLFKRCVRMFRRSNDVVGPIVDFLQFLDPNVISKCPERQRQILFSTFKRYNGVAYRCSFLLSILVHHVEWSIIENTMKELLTDALKYDASVVLDFIWACVFSPKIWQGIESQKVESAHMLYDLNDSEIKCLVKYFILDAVAYGNETPAKSADDSGRSTPFSSHGEFNLKRAEDRVESRFLLLKVCLRKDRNLIETAAKSLFEAEDHDEVAGIIAQQLFYEFPFVLNLLNSEQLHTMQCMSMVKLDVVTFRLLTAFMHTRGRRREVIIDLAHKALSKLAASYPLLFLRQFPTLTSLLRGRVHRTFNEFKSKKHLLIFTYTQTLMNLLKPHIFNEIYRDSLQEVIDMYFMVFKVYYRQTDELGSLLGKFMDFLVSYIEHSPTESVSYLRKYHKLMLELAQKYDHMSQLRSIAGLFASDMEDGDELTPPLYIPRPSTPFQLPQLKMFRNKISASSSLQETLATLKDLDEASRRKVELLPYFIEELKRLMSSEDGNCRNLAYSLVLRHIRVNPLESKELVLDYLRCFESKNSGIVITALENLPEMVLFCQEKAKDILQKAFALDVNDIGVSTKLSEAVQVLNLETFLQDPARTVVDSLKTRLP